MRYFGNGLVAVLAILAAVPASAEYVASSTLNCRSAPSTSAPIVARLSRNEAVRVLAWSGDWARVEPARLAPCWAAARYLAGAPVAHAPASNSGGANMRAAPRQSYGQPPRRAGTASGSRPRSQPAAGGSCPCSGSRVCIGPRGGRYCITSGGNRRYGV